MVRTVPRMKTKRSLVKKLGVGKLSGGTEEEKENGGMKMQMLLVCVCVCVCVAPPNHLQMLAAGSVVATPNEEI